MVVSKYFINIELSMLSKHIVLDFAIKIKLVMFYVPSSGSQCTTAHLLSLLLIYISKIAIFVDRFRSLSSILYLSVHLNLTKASLEVYLVILVNLVFDYYDFASF